MRPLKREAYFVAPKEFVKQLQAKIFSAAASREDCSDNRET